MIRAEEERLEEQLRRKEQKTRLLGYKTNSEVDQQYYELVQQKLLLLQRAST